MSEAVLAGTYIDATLTTNDVIRMTAASDGTTLTGAYTVGASDATSDLGVSSFTVGTVTDKYGNALTSTTIPSDTRRSNIRIRSIC